MLKTTSSAFLGRVERFEGELNEWFNEVIGKIVPKKQTDSSVREKCEKLEKFSHYLVFFWVAANLMSYGRALSPKFMLANDYVLTPVVVGTSCPELVLNNLFFLLKKLVIVS